MEKLQISGVQTQRTHSAKSRRTRQLQIGASAAALALLVPIAASRIRAGVAAAVPAPISGRVFSDINANGVSDSGEVGVAGVTVTVYDDAGAVVGTTTTGATGSWSVSGTGSATLYRVEYTNLQGYYPGKNGTSNRSTVQFLTGASQSNLGLTNSVAIEIGNRVWKDTDRDGIQDPSEAPISGVVVQLFLNGSVVATTTTNASGNYYFAGLNPNTAYSIEIATAQSSLTGLGPSPADAPAISPDGTQDDSDSDGVPDSAITPTRVVASLTTGGPGANDHTFDFGFNTPIPVPTTTTIPETTTTTIPETTTTTIPETTTTTIPETDVTFVLPGSTTIPQTDVTFPEPVSTTTPQTDITFPEPVSTTTPQTVTTVALPVSTTIPQTVTTVAPPVSTTTPQTVATFPEPVSTTTTPDNFGIGKPTEATTTANPAVSVAPTVAQTVPAATQTTTVTSTTSTLDTTTTTPEKVVTTTTPTATPSTVAPKPIVLGSIGDRVWLDRNSDGEQGSDELGIPQAMVRLTTPDGSTQTTTTDDNGNFFFAGLPAGTYAVEVLGTAKPSNGTTVRTVTLVEGANDLNQDFGYTTAEVKGIQTERALKLAFTGANTLNLVATALMAVAAGTLLLFRRRRNTKTTN